jgi:hypothetical protein
MKASQLSMKHLRPTTKPPSLMFDVLSGWPPGLFESTAGAWEGEPLVWEPEGEVEQRDTLP